MAYDFYCMNCGQRISQDTAIFGQTGKRAVLFDMQYLLTGSIENHFKILKFRLTKAEVEANTKNDRFSLPFADIMRFIGNDNNTKQKNVENLQWEDLENYWKEYERKSVLIDENGEDNSKSDDNSFWGAELSAFSFGESATEPEMPANNEHAEEKVQTEEQQEYVAPEGITYLESLDETNTNKAVTRRFLAEDFQLLMNAFARNSSNEADRLVDREIKKYYEKDNDKNDVLTGYRFRRSGSIWVEVNNARVCPRCSAPVLLHAGTAEHKAVCFIGSPAAGKTSIILALADYANYGMTFVDEDNKATRIWSNCSKISSVRTPDLLSPTPKLTKEMSGYLKGYAPDKTRPEKRDDAYSASFRIKNTIEDKYYLLSLVDLPGELCVKKETPDDIGKVDREKIANEFPIALASDAFVACFDTRYNERDENTMFNDIMKGVCNWTNDFQEMRMYENNASGFAPTILLFTKCKELEELEQSQQLEQSIQKSNSRVRSQLERTYMFCEDDMRIQAVPKYQAVCEEFNNRMELKMAYHAMLRCSPYGYAAPSEEYCKDHGVSPQMPTPYNIDLLMRWLLSVSGCIPVEGSYASVPGDPPYTLRDYCLKRPQIRTEKPNKTGTELQESCARCILFRNPGVFDKKILENYDSRPGLRLAKLEMAFPNTKNVN